MKNTFTVIRKKDGHMAHDTVQGYKYKKDVKQAYKDNDIVVYAVLTDTQIKNILNEDSFERTTYRGYKQYVNQVFDN